ncbi:patatin-like phospholipase family protein [Thalassotalea sp. PLHSN55]|uniref:patatin-like phospholipase family protein n=1 Tax=Thalassotalea sp. PLHSN55 TaxID=3435888 RepID=UPI003F871023
MPQLDKSTEQSTAIPNFEQEVLNSEIQEIQKRRLLNKAGEVICRNDFDCVDVEQFFDDKTQRSDALNNALDDLYSEENNAAWDKWQAELDPKTTANDPIRKGFIGVAFSGGGIRSATFNLGVLQALNSIGIFKCVDYLSTVSGGGYIGSCVSALYASIDQQSQQIQDTKKGDGSQKNQQKSADKSSDDEQLDINNDPNNLSVFPFEHKQGERESSVFRYLRNHANYLAPGGFTDTLRIPAILLRGIIVNFLVLLPYLLLAAILTVWLMPTANHIAGTEMVNIFGLFELSSRFILTKCLIGFFIMVMALFPLFWRFIALKNSQRSMAGWNRREKIGKFMSGYVVLTAIVAFIELQPIAIKFIHDLETETFSSANMSMLSGTISALLAMFSNHLLPKMNKFIGVFWVYVIGALGFATMWLVYLALCSAAVDWDVASHELVIDNANRFFNDYERLQLIIIAAIGLIMLYQWLKRRCACINFQTSIAFTCAFAMCGVAAFGYHHFINEIPIAKLSTVDLTAEKLALLAHYSTIGFLLWLYGLVCVDVNFTSIHRFYRDKLSNAYIIGMKRKSGNKPAEHSNDVVRTEGVKLSQLNSYRAPYHLINSLLNLEKTTESHQNGRRGDFFIFSKNYIGGEITGYCPTKKMEAVSRHIDLATAMAISGAAAAPNAGKVTVKPLIFIMAMLNIRLNYWLVNPGNLNDKNSRFYNCILTRVGPAYLFRELFGKPDAKHHFVDLSDGGHIENLGVYELLRRQCRLIIAGDGEADKQLTFQGLSELIRMAQIDMGIKIEMQGLDEIRRGEQHHAIGTIHYGGGRIGKLIYLKSSLLGDNNLQATLGKEQYTTSADRDDNSMFNNNAYIAHYKANNPDFPHQSTADQFFDEAQFECYRALGYQVAMSSLSKSSNIKQE